MSREKNLAVVASLFGVSGAVAWSLYVLALRRELGPDWMVFYTAARAYFDGNLPLIFDGESFTAALNARFADWLAIPVVFLPWVNPPNFLLLVLPFSLLPFGLSYAIFQAVGLVLLLAALALQVKDVARWRLFAFALALCPATAFTLFVGQSSFLTVALLVGGFAVIERRPIVAGILFGVLTYKPQFCLMIPIALLAGRQWRAIASAAVTAAIIIGASVGFFGVEPWRVWLEFAAGMGEAYQRWAATGRLLGQSVYACVVLLGGTAALAKYAQAAAMIFAAATVYWCFHRPMRGELKLAVLLTATLLAAPHVSTSDGLLAGIAAILFLSVALDEGFQPGDTLIIFLVWLSPLSSPPSFSRIGTLIPLLFGIFIAWVARRSAGLPIDLKTVGGVS